jgi:hypothetical protein
MPMYVPPKRGAPASRVGGGTRGTDSNGPSIVALAPDHTGLTNRAQPTLYWYLSQPAATQLEITIINDESINPLLEKSLPTPKQAGIQSVSLADQGITLKPGVEYRWFVALVPDKSQRSNDIIAGGTIMYVKQDAALGSKLSAAKTPADKAATLAQEGVWYDAIDTLSTAINKSGSSALKQQRAALLSQVGLNEAAAADSN